MYDLISSLPSPYARKVRIALHEKSIPFKLITEVPYDHTTSTPRYNPLEKLPILIPHDTTTDPVYESHFILEYLEAKHPGYPLVSHDIDEKLFAKRVEVVADGVCDAVVLSIFESHRQHPSEAWLARQSRKIEGGLRALDSWVRVGGDYVVGNSFGLADIAIGAVCGYIRIRRPDYPLQEEFPSLVKFSDKLEERESFKLTRPGLPVITDRVV